MRWAQRGAAQWHWLWSGTSWVTHPAVEGQLLIHISLVKEITPLWDRRDLQPLKLLSLPTVPETSM